MVLGNEFQKKLETAMLETKEDKAQELIKLGTQYGKSYANVSVEVSKLPENYQTIFIAGMLDGLLSSVYETCSDEADGFIEFMRGLFSLADEETME